MDKKNSTKKAIIFGAVFVLCTALGVLLGYLSSKNSSKEIFDSLAGFIKSYSIYAALPIYVIGVAAVSIIQAKMFASGKALGSKLDDDDDDETFDKVNRRLETPLNLSNVFIIIMCILFAVIIEGALFNSSFSKTARTVICIGSSVIFIGAYLYQFVLTRGIIEYYKTLNPEKRGDMLDMDFQNKWLSSLDESEKYSAYRCGFHAYKNTNYACMLLWVISFISQLTFDTGVMAVICTGILWLVLTCSYISEAKRIDKNGAQR